MKKKRLSIALAAVLLAAGTTGVMAAGYSSGTPSEKPGASTTMSKPRASTMAKPDAKDTLSLASTQQQKAWNDLKGQSSNQTAPSGFQSTIGSAVPSGVKIAPVPSKAATDVPALKPYDFAMVSGKLLIVNPSDKKIVEVITG